MPMDNQLLYGFAIAMVVLVLILIGMVASLRRSLKAEEIRKALAEELAARHGEVMRRLEALEALEDKVRRSNEGVEQLRVELINMRNVTRELSESIRDLGDTRVAAVESRIALLMQSLKCLNKDEDKDGKASEPAAPVVNAELASQHPGEVRPAAKAGDEDKEAAPVPFDRDDLEATVRMVGDVTAETAKKAAVVTAAAAKTAGKWLEKSWLKIKKSREEAAGPHVVEELSHPEALHDEDEPAPVKDADEAPDVKPESREEGKVEKDAKACEKPCSGKACVAPTKDAAVMKPEEKPAAESAEKPEAKPAVKPAEKPAEKAEVKAAEKPAEKPAAPVKPVEPAPAKTEKSEKAEKPAKEAKPGKSDKAEKPVKDAKVEKVEKAAKPEKAEKAAKIEKAEKAEKPAKSEKDGKPADGNHRPGKPGHRHHARKGAPKAEVKSEVKAGK